MTLSTCLRVLAPPALALTLAFAIAPASALAEEPGPAAGTTPSEGRPLDGYFATGLFAGAAMFAVAKTARR